MTNTTFNVSPELLAAILQIQEFRSNYQLSFELKGYRPARRVITKKMPDNPSPEYLMKRKLLVRYSALRHWIGIGSSSLSGTCDSARP